MIRFIALFFLALAMQTASAQDNNKKEVESNNIVVFLTIQYYCLSLRHE